MPILPANYVDGVESVLGKRLADYVRVTANNTRPFVDDHAENFSVAGTKTKVPISPDDPVIDIGGRIRNESLVAVPVGDIAGTSFGQLVEQEAGLPVGPGSSGAFFVHHTVDPGFTSSRGLGVAQFPGACLFVIPPSRDALHVVFVDGSGARVTPAKIDLPDPARLRRWFDRRTPPRQDRFDADVDHVYRETGSTVQRVRIATRAPIDVPYPVTDGLVLGASGQRVTLARESETVGSATPSEQVTVTVGQSRFGAVRSGLRAENVPSSDGGGRVPVDEAPSDPAEVLNWKITSATDQAPFGYVWGEPGSVALCTNPSQSGCLGCCQTITGRYWGAAVGAFSTGAATSGGALLGIVTIPVAWAPIAVGAAVGAVIGLAGLIHGSFCSSGCYTLYSRDSGEEVRLRRYELSAAEVDPQGQRVAYRATVEHADGTTMDVTIPTNQLYSLVWGRGRVEIPSPTGRPAIVTLARRPGGTGLYLRSFRDRQLTNNFSLLPEVPLQ